MLCFSSQGDWMCFAYFINKRSMAGDATLWTKKNVDLCFCFLKEIWSFRLPNSLLEEPDGFVSSVSFGDSFGLSLSRVKTHECACPGSCREWRDRNSHAVSLTCSLSSPLLNCLIKLLSLFALMWSAFGFSFFNTQLRTLRFRRNCFEGSSWEILCGKEKKNGDKIYTCGWWCSHCHQHTPKMCLE